MKKNRIGYFIIGSAIIWGAVIIGGALILKDNPARDDIARILSGGAVIHLLFIWGPLAGLSRKEKE